MLSDVKMLHYESDHCLLERDAVYFDDSSNQRVISAIYDCVYQVSALYSIDYMEPD